MNKAGEFYMIHLMRGCLGVEGETERVVALLHDIVEDGHMRMVEIEESFDGEAVGAVAAITKRKGETYPDYLARVKANKTTLVVKLSDIADNSCEPRLSKIDTQTADRLREKYGQAREYLGRD
ncbi:hypothetical protein FMN50_23410 [Rhodobacterales bacterium]|nr:hypothetical protein FMN50_23410 [Rhodobacterales bacterium]